MKITQLFVSCLGMIFISEFTNSLMIQKKGDHRVAVVLNYIPKEPFFRVNGHNYCKYNQLDASEPK